MNKKIGEKKWMKLDDNEKKDENSGPGLRFSVSKNLEPSGSKNKLVKTVFFFF